MLMSVTSGDSSSSDEPSPDAPDLRVSRLGSTIVVSVASMALPECLSESERQIAQAVIGGRSNVEIARARGRAVKTVANQLHGIYRKLGVGSRDEMVALLTQRGPIDVDDDEEEDDES